MLVKFIAGTYGSHHRFMWCEACQSVRLHQLWYLDYFDYGKETWVRYTGYCLGVAPRLPRKLRRLERSCYHPVDGWLKASQWNALIKQDSYAA